MHRLISGAAALVLVGTTLMLGAPTGASATPGNTPEAASAAPLFEVTPDRVVSRTAVGHSEALTAKITANRPMTLTGPNLTAAADSEDTRAFSGVCPASQFDRVTLQPGEFCELTWTTRPTKMQTVATMLSFTAQEVTAAGAPVGDPEVSGIALDLVSTVLEFTPSVEFPQTPVGESAVESLRLTNAATVDALVTLTLFPGAFSLASPENGPEVRVPAGGSLDVPVRFSPAQESGITEWGDLEYKLDDGSSQRRSSFVKLSGTGIASTDPAPIVASASPVDFGNVTVGDTARDAIVLSNNGTEDVAFMLPAPEVVAATGLTVGELPDYGFVAPGDSIELAVSWTPQAAGELAQSLEFEVSRVLPAFAKAASTDPGPTTVTSALTGLAVATVPPTVGGGTDGPDGGTTTPPTPPAPRPAAGSTQLAHSGSGSMVAASVAATLALAGGTAAMLLARRRASRA